MGARPATLGRAPRVVLDTSVVVSALVFETGRLAWLRGAWRRGAIRPLVSRDTVTELLRVLAYPKFQLAAGEQEVLLADYLPFCTAVTLGSVPRNMPRCRDPHDLPFLALAAAGKAKYLVTGDEDLLVLRDRFRVAILTPAELERALE